MKDLSHAQEEETSNAMWSLMATKVCAAWKTNQGCLQAPGDPMLHDGIELAPPPSKPAYLCVAGTLVASVCSGS